MRKFSLIVNSNLLFGLSAVRIVDNEASSETSFHRLLCYELQLQIDCTKLTMFIFHFMLSYAFFIAAHLISIK